MRLILLSHGCKKSKVLAGLQITSLLNCTAFGTHSKPFRDLCPSRINKSFFSGLGIFNACKLMCPMKYFILFIGLSGFHINVIVFIVIDTFSGPCAAALTGHQLRSVESVGHQTDLCTSLTRVHRTSDPCSFCLLKSRRVAEPSPL